MVDELGRSQAEVNGRGSEERVPGEPGKNMITQKVEERRRSGRQMKIQFAMLTKIVEEKLVLKTYVFSKKKKERGLKREGQHCRGQFGNPRRSCEDWGLETEVKVEIDRLILGLRLVVSS